MEPLKLDLIVDDDFGNLESVITKVRPDWTWQMVNKKIFTAGITNKITGFYLNTDTKWSDMLLVRRYGYNTELIIDRKCEQLNMRIVNTTGSGAPLYAILSNALVYGFIPGQTTDASSIRLPEISELVAKEMAYLHSIDLSKYPEVPTIEPLMFRKIEGFTEKIPDTLTDHKKRKTWESFGWSLDGICAEIKFIESLVHHHFPSTPCGFTHNDLLLENVVYNREKGTINFIDFEYGCYSYLYFDIGNHFCEYAGVGDEDHSRYPNETYQKQWLKIYLREYHKLNALADTMITERLIDDIYNQVRVFSLAAYLFWGVWAFFQAEYSAVDFDYIAFARSRLGAYYEKKEKFIAPYL